MPEVGGGGVVPAQGGVGEGVGRGVGAWRGGRGAWQVGRLELLRGRALRLHVDRHHATVHGVLEEKEVVVVVVYHVFIVGNKHR